MKNQHLSLSHVTSKSLPTGIPSTAMDPYHSNWQLRTPPLDAADSTSGTPYFNNNHNAAKSHTPHLPSFNLSNNSHAVNHTPQIPAERRMTPYDQKTQAPRTALQGHAPHPYSQQQRVGQHFQQRGHHMQRSQAMRLDSHDDLTLDMDHYNSYMRLSGSISVFARARQPSSLSPSNMQHRQMQSQYGQAQGSPRHAQQSLSTLHVQNPNVGDGRMDILAMSNPLARSGATGDLQAMPWMPQLPQRSLYPAMPVLRGQHLYPSPSATSQRRTTFLPDEQWDIQRRRYIRAVPSQPSTRMFPTPNPRRFAQLHQQQQQEQTQRLHQQEVQHQNHIQQSSPVVAPCGKAPDVVPPQPPVARLKTSRQRSGHRTAKRATGIKLDGSLEETPRRKKRGSTDGAQEHEHKKQRTDHEQGVSLPGANGRQQYVSSMPPLMTPSSRPFVLPSTMLVKSHAQSPPTVVQPGSKGATSAPIFSSPARNSTDGMNLGNAILPSPISKRGRYAPIQPTRSADIRAGMEKRSTGGGDIHESRGLQISREIAAMKAAEQNQGLTKSDASAAVTNKGSQHIKPAVVTDLDNKAHRDNGERRNGDNSKSITSSPPQQQIQKLDTVATSTSLMEEAQNHLNKLPVGHQRIVRHNIEEKVKGEAARNPELMRILKAKNAKRATNEDKTRFNAFLVQTYQWALQMYQHFREDSKLLNGAGVILTQQDSGRDITEAKPSRDIPTPSTATNEAPKRQPVKRAQPPASKDKTQLPLLSQLSLAAQAHIQRIKDERIKGFAENNASYTQNWEDIRRGTATPTLKARFEKWDRQIEQVIIEQMLARHPNMPIAPRDCSAPQVSADLLKTLSSRLVQEQNSEWSIASIPASPGVASGEKNHVGLTEEVLHIPQQKPEEAETMPTIKVKFSALASSAPWLPPISQRPAATPAPIAQPAHVSAGPIDLDSAQQPPPRLDQGVTYQASADLAALLDNAAASTGNSPVSDLEVALMRAAFAEEESVKEIEPAKWVDGMPYAHAKTVHAERYR